MSEKLLNEAHRRIDALQKVVDQQATEITSLKTTAESQWRDITFLKGAISTLQSQPKPAAVTAPSSLREPSVQIADVPVSNRGFIFPNPGQYQQLMRLVASKYSRFAGETVKADEFERAFKFVAQLGRTEKLSQYSLGGWLDEVSIFCKHNGLGHADISAETLCAAVVAHDDVKYRVEQFPVGVAFGLMVRGQRLPDGKAWQRALAAGQFSMTPIAMPRVGLDVVGMVPRIQTPW